MADLTITLNGDSADFKKQFDQAIQSLKKFSDSTKEGQGYISGMESKMKLLKTQMRSASEQDIPALRTQFLNLKTSIREAQYGTETFTSKIGGQFDQALNKASRRLFDLGNTLKASIGFLSVAGIAGTFVEATGAAKAFEETIQDVVWGLKQLNKTGVDLSIASTGDVLEASQKLLDSQIPANLQLINRIDEQIKILRETKTTVDPSSITKAAFMSSVLGYQMPIDARPITEDEQNKINKRIALLESYRIEIEKVGDSAKGAGEGVSDLNDRIGIGDINKDTEGLDSSTFMQELEMEIDAEKRANAILEQEKFDAWLKRHEDMTAQDAKQTGERLQAEKKIADARVEYMDRAGTRIARTFENALSAGLRGGFQDFLQNYMQQTGLRLFSGLLRLAFSAATGGGFGVGNLLGHIFGFAGGGEFYTRGPMPIMVGDNPGGVEKVTVEPISGKGTSGLKNGNLALAGGGSVMSAPLSGGGGNAVYEITLELDKVNLGKVFYQPNGVLETINRMRANPE